MIDKIAFIIAEYFNYEDTVILIKIDGKYHSVSSGWEEGFELAGGSIEYAPDYKEFQDYIEFNRFRESMENTKDELVVGKEIT